MQTYNFLSVLTRPEVIQFAVIVAHYVFDLVRLFTLRRTLSSKTDFDTARGEAIPYSWLLEQTKDQFQFGTTVEELFALYYTRRMIPPRLRWRQIVARYIELGIVSHGDRGLLKLTPLGNRLLSFLSVCSSAKPYSVW
jgi:hypothetical protein